VARLVIRDCDTLLPTEGAAVTVEDADAVTVASGTTDDTGTVALLLPEIPGATYTATAVKAGEADAVVEFTATCAVNEVVLRFGLDPLSDPPPTVFCATVLTHDGTPVGAGYTTLLAGHHCISSGPTSFPALAFGAARPGRL
jgi:hypothetical protein